MWSQVKMFLCKDKKGVSIMIGYVLLVTSAIVMSVVVYQWIKTYVPTEALECPDGVSIFIKEYAYDCDSDELTITLKNNGRFNLAGYFIHARNEKDQELATIDISSYTALGKDKGGVVLFGSTNLFEPGDEKTSVFDLSDIGQIYAVEIIPVRFEEIEGRARFASCGKAKIEEILNCGGVVVEEGGTCTEGEVQDCPLQEGVCEDSQRTCTEDEEWPSCDYGSNYEGTETTCDDGLDNDCDGDTDSEDSNCGSCTEGETQLCALQEGVCLGSEQTCTDGDWSECDYGSNYEGTETTCDDGLDNDCDGDTDSEDSDCEEECTSHSYFQCYSSDVYWYDSCNVRETKKEECGTSGYTGSNYCYNNDVYRDYVTRGCDGDECTSSTEKKKQQECGIIGCKNGKCGTVICTELYNSGYLTKEEYEIDLKYGSTHFSPEALKGYHAFAIPAVKIMRKRPQVIGNILPLVKSFTEEMAYRLGEKENGNEVGALFLDKGLPLFERIGVLINEPNWQSLFAENSQDKVDSIFQSKKYDDIVKNYFTEEKIKEMFYDSLERSEGLDVLFAYNLIENLERAVEEIELKVSLLRHPDLLLI